MLDLVDLQREAAQQMASLTAAVRDEFDLPGAEGADTPSYWGFRVCNRTMAFAALACHSTKRTDVVPFYAWKRDPDPATTEQMADELAALVAAWFPVRGPDWIVTAPPAGRKPNKNSQRRLSGRLPGACRGNHFEPRLRDHAGAAGRQTLARGTPVAGTSRVHGDCPASICGNCD